MYFSKKEWTLDHFEKSKANGKMYAAIIQNKKTGDTRRINFGSSIMENFQDKTGLNLYPELIHGDLKRRHSYRARAASKVRKDFLSASYFSYFYLW